MAQLEELEETRLPCVNGEVIEEGVGGGPAYYDDRGQLFNDLENGVTLLKRAKTIIDYLSDKELCKQISSRERTIMIRVGESLTEYLNDVGPAMAEMEE